MKYLNVLILLAIFSILVGCFDLNQQLVINDDDTAKYKMDLLMATNIAKMAGSGDDFCSNLKISVGDKLTTNTEKKESGGNVICSVIVEGPLEEFQTLSIVQEDRGSIKIDKLNPKLYRISSDFSSLKKSDDAKDNNSLAEGMLATMFINRAIRWDITAPKIVNSNGNINLTNKSVHWELPLATVFSGPTDTDLNFYADVIISDRYSWAYAIWYKILSFFETEEDINAMREGFKDFNEKQTLYARLEKEKEDKIKQRKNEKRKLFLATQEKRLEDIEKSIIEFENKRFNAKNATQKLKNFTVLKASFHKKKRKYGGTIPIIKLTVKNDMGHAISRAYFKGTLISDGRSVPWLEEEFNYQISGGIESGETNEWSLAPNRFSDWGTVDIAQDAKFIVEVTDLDDANGNRLIPFSDRFSERDENKLKRLKEDYNSQLDLINLYKNKID